MWAGLSVAPAVGRAQVFQIQGGGSSLFSGYGGAVNIWGNGYEASIGVGYLDGLRLTATSRHLIGHDTLRVGNDVLTIDLPSDEFGAGSAVLVQGVGVQGLRGRTSMRAFAGASASALAAPFFSASRAEHALAFVHAEHNYSRTLALFGDALFTTRQSLFAGATWRPRSAISTSATLGLGNNAPYAAVSIDSRGARVDVKGQYVLSGTGYRRADVPMPYQSEVERENVLTTVRLSPNATVSFGRQHFRQDSSSATIASRASLNQVSANWRNDYVTLGGGVFDANSQHVRNVSSFASASRMMNRWLQADLYLLRVWEPVEARATTPILYLRESVSPQFNLLQMITRENGRTSVSFGGGVSSGLNSLSIDYQIVHTPYRTANPFVHSLGLNARAQLGSYQLSIGSFVTPDGRVNYAASGSTFLYRGLAALGASAMVSGGRIDRYVVLGRVVDEAQHAVEGAAIEIGGETVYTDSRGQFFARRSTPRALTFRVVPDDFLVPGTFEVVDAPSKVTPTIDAKATPLLIVVRRSATR